MGNYYCDELLNSIISDSIGAASISNGIWHSTTITLTPYRGTVADALVYGHADTLSEAVAYHRRKLNESFDNPWHTEVRETYRLEPKAPMWHLPLIACLFSLACNLSLAFYKHEATRDNLEAIGLGFIIAFCGIYSVVRLWDKFTRSPKPS